MTTVRFPYGLNVLITWRKSDRRKQACRWRSPESDDTQLDAVGGELDVDAIAAALLRHWPPCGAAPARTQVRFSDVEVVLVVAMLGPVGICPSNDEASLLFCRLSQRRDADPEPLVEEAVLRFSQSIKRAESDGVEALATSSSSASCRPNERRGKIRLVVEVAVAAHCSGNDQVEVIQFFEDLARRRQL